MLQKDSTSIQWNGSTPEKDKNLTSLLPKPLLSIHSRKIRLDAKEPKYGLSSSHTAKTDLSVFSSNISNLLTDLSNHSHELDLTLRPDKCISVAFDGKRMDSKTTFSLANRMAPLVTSQMSPQKFSVNLLQAHYL